LLFLSFQRALVDGAGFEFTLNLRQLAADRVLIVVAALGLIDEGLKHPLPAGYRHRDREREKLEQAHRESSLCLNARPARDMRARPCCHARANKVPQAAALTCANQQNSLVSKDGTLFASAKVGKQGSALSGGGLSSMVAPRSKHRGGRQHRNSSRSGAAAPLKELAGDLGQYVRKGAQAVSTEAKTAFVAAAQEVRDEAQRLLDERKEKAATRLDTAGSAVRRTAHALRAVKAEAVADYADAAGDALANAARFVEDADLEDLAKEATRFARRHPAVVISGLLVAGFIVARAIKASASDGDEDDAGDSPQRVRVRRRRR
jgi:hypothetical protein